MSGYKPGDRVALRHEISVWPAGLQGTVQDVRVGLLNGFDCAVILDGRKARSCFNDDELEPAPPHSRPDGKSEG